MEDRLINEVPQISAALLLYSNDSTNILAAKHDLELCLNKSLTANLYTPEPDCRVIQLIHTGYIRSWYLSEVVEHMFQLIHDQLDEIRAIKQRYHCTAQIDIAFCHYDRYPALIFEGDAMKNIIKLEAEISIDPY